MADASFIQSNFGGGEVSKFMQGRFDLPAYRTWMNSCLNSLPIDTGAWVRRPGFEYAQHTRYGHTAKLIKFDFQQNAPYNMEFTDAELRFFTGTSLVMTNDAMSIVSVSTANPAVFVVPANTWGTGEQVMFSNLGATCPLLQNRQFVLVPSSSTQFTLLDPLTLVPIDGAPFTDFVSGTVSRILEIATPYLNGSWSTLRSVQAERSAVLLHGGYKPRALVATPGLPPSFASFALTAADLLDGPYNDPIPTSIVTSSGLTGNVSLTFSFVAYDATVSYAIGDFVTSVGVGYRSRTAANQNHIPAANPTNWEVVLGGTPVGPNGFIASDVGRSIRLFSEPSLYDATATYASGQVVAFNGAYWTATAAIGVGVQPGVSLLWAVAPAAARWTWGQITAISASGLINPVLPGSVNIGTMTGGGGLAAAFDGVTSQTNASSASFNATTAGTDVTLAVYCGKNYSGASAQTIASATVYPSTDDWFAFATWRDSLGIDSGLPASSLFVVLRAKHTAPANSADGTVLGTTGVFANTPSPMTITSNDQTTAWEYVWVELNAVFHKAGAVSINAHSSFAEVQFYTPGVSNGSVVSFQIRGPALLYANAIRIWRLGTYSDTSGWPTAGTYHEGRLWLTGAVDNRVDSSKSNDLFNFAPTNPDGSVSANNAISYIFNAPDVNPLYWMEPDLQGIICGSQAGEWILRPPTAGAMSPTNISAQRVTKIGCANIEPRRTDHTTVFVQKFARRIMEYFADVFSGKFTAPDLTLTAKHLTAGYIDEIAWQQELAPVIWSRVNGELRGCTYRRDSLMSSQGPNMAGWHRHAFASGDVIESIVVGPSTDGNLDALSIVNYNPATNIRHVEVLTDIYEEGDALADAWYLDDAVVPSSTSNNAATVPVPYGSITLNGLWHLNGKTVQIFAAGLDLGQRSPGATTFTDFVVSNGSVTVPYGDSISAGPGAGLFTFEFATAAIAAGQIVVGFTYTSDGQIVRPNSPQESGARSGPAFAKKRRSQKYGILVENTAGMSIGTTFAKLDPVLFKDDAGNALLPGVTYSGIGKTTLTDDYSYDSMICWRVTRPLPANVMAISEFLQTQDE